MSKINLEKERRRFKPLSVSVGICSAPYAASSAKELMDNADLAAYNAKQGGKDQIVVFRGASDWCPAFGGADGRHRGPDRAGRRGVPDGTFHDLRPDGSH